MKEILKSKNRYIPTWFSLGSDWSAPLICAAVLKRSLRLERSSSLFFRWLNTDEKRTMNINGIY